jgi:hypothetical protein
MASPAQLCPFGINLTVPVLGSSSPPVLVLPILPSVSGFADSPFQVLQCCFKFSVWHIGLWQKAAFLSDLPHKLRGFRYACGFGGV